MKKWISWALLIAMLLGHFHFVSPITSEALDIGNGATVTSVKFIKQHVGYDVTGGNVIIIGTNLTGVNVLFEVQGGIPKSIGTLHQDSNAFFLNYVFDFNDAESFNGKIYIGNKLINLNTPSFPNIQSSDKAIVNQDLAQTLKLSGSNLNLINNTTITGQYGRGIQLNRILDTSIPPVTSNLLEFTPTAPGPLGYQDIVLTQNTVGDPNIEVTYYYQNAFRLLQNLDIAPVSMYPNAASKGDLITLSSSKFSDSKNYAVYFLNATDNDFAFTADKKSPYVALSADKQRLTVQVPNTNIPLGTKRVVIVDIVNNQIVARYDMPDAFNLLDAVFKPTIQKINPNVGTDEGASFQIIGRNLISPNIPELVSSTGSITISSAVPQDSAKTMLVNYQTGGLTFKGVAVSSMTRKIRTFVSKQAFYELSGPNVRYSKIGADDYLYLISDIIDDAETDPLKDVIVEIDTSIADTLGNVFTFSQSVTVLDGFEFIPSSIEPVITSITPAKIQIGQTLFPKEKTLLSIKGDKFLVNKYTDLSGVIQTNYPVVLMQITTNLGDSDYVIKFDKNDTTGSPEGSIYDKNGVQVGVGVDMVVLNNLNQVVDGSVGNEIGTRIVLYLPKTVQLAAGGKKNLQVINPKRNSNDLGDGKVVLDFVDFVQATDTPVIESVTPSIITADSKAQIKIKGSNFQNGVKVFIDGVDVGNVLREVDPQGTGMTLTLTAPVGRVTKTQIQVLNPLGGLAVRDFFYVQSFNQDPQITKVSPAKGTVDTVVVVSGNNFFKRDPAAETDTGLDAYRLLGTRLFLDGKDVNTYNFNANGEIDFADYTAPDNTYVLFGNVAGKISLSPFYKNTVITSSDNSKVYQITFDADLNPQLHDGNEVIYTFKYNATDGYQAFDSAGLAVGSFSFNATTITVNDSVPVSFNVTMNNNLLRPNYSISKELYADLADYWYGVVLEDTNTGEFYTLSKQADNTLRLTNGQFSVYDIKTTGSNLLTPGFKAVDQTQVAFDVTTSATGLNIATAQPIDLKMVSAYAIDPSTRQITGNRVKVEAKEKLIFSVPNLTSGTGPKNVTVVNPDTKSATLTNGFYYYHLPATQPTIASIVPNIGSVAGGYIIKISGRDYRQTSSVYIDGILVPPGDMTVNLSGTAIEVKVPKYPVDITTVYGVSQLTVPVVIVNNDGGSASKVDGFTYVKPASTPKITQVILGKGTTNGGQVVEIIGEDFRFFEPYINVGGGPGYDAGIDTFTNINSLLPVTTKWDNLLTTRYDGLVDLWEEKPMPNGANYFGYDYYYDAKILPRVYFGTQQAKIVDFDTDYIKVITPANTAGVKGVIVMNNDAGVSNVVNYTYESSNPKITYINPNQGARTGGELRELVGSGFANSTFKAYQDDDATTIVDAGSQVEMLVRFGNLTNETISVGQANDGRINANRATVNITGGLSVSYDGNANTFTASLEEGGKIYTRVFTNFTGSTVYVPAGMLKNGADYYQPFNYGYQTPTVYNTATDYEWIQVRVDSVAKRLYVARGFSPEVDFETTGKLTLRTPSYYTIDPVTVYAYNPDGGVATTLFNYKNPASRPIIEAVKPFEVIPANSVENPTGIEQRMVQAAVSGGIDFEIRGSDFRDGAKVFLGTKEAQVLDITYDSVTNQDVIIAKVPAGKDTEIGTKFPIIVQNTDGGIANSTDTLKLGTDKRLIYFIYRKPLSLPVITEIVPKLTSQFGGNTVEIRGTDFRAGALVIIGSIGGVPVTPFEIEPLGRFIRFIVPTTLSAGIKNVQVINADFGTVTSNGGLTVVSYPTVVPSFTTESGAALSVLSTQGGQRMVITGTNFQSGAKVVFGGQRVLKVAGSTGVEGVFKDDKVYMVQGGAQATKVEFVDATKLIVTTPEVFVEKDYTITIINPDKGLSDQNAVIRYQVPKPSAPANLKATVVNNQYIKLYDYTADGVKYYEMYTYLGRLTPTQLINNNYTNFKALGTTALEPYKITRLDGFEKLVDPDKIYFVLKAVNEYGTSSWSNIVSVPYSSYKNIVTLGDPDTDGGLLPSLNQIATSDLVGNTLTVLFTADKFNSNIEVDMTKSSFQNMNQLKVLFPKTMVQNNYNRMFLRSNLLDMNYIPYGFNTSALKAQTLADSFATWTTSWVQDSMTGALVSQLPRTLKTVSPVVTMTFETANNFGQKALGTLVVPVEVRFNLESQMMKSKAAVYQVYFYDPVKRTWQVISSTRDTANNEVKINVNQSGYYVLTAPN